MALRAEFTTGNYVIRVCDRTADVDALAWDGLLATQTHPTPFMRLGYLSALEASGSATAATGWACNYLLVTQQDRLVGACVLYLKSHSYGEYVFDWAWAQAHERHGLPYYPKLLAAVPFTPVPGSRLLAADEPARDALVGALGRLCQDSGLSSAHVLFLSPADREALAAAGWMIREGVQFHWQQDPELPCRDFDDLVSRMARHKRKNILQERRRVREAGIAFTVHEGLDISPSLWDHFYTCYESTYAAHASTPYLTRDFFTRMARDLPQHWVLFVGRRESSGQPVAASLLAVDHDLGHAWGRYWGALEPVPMLHFEACYYQPLAWCLKHGIRRFEGGAQGEHKMARGLLPVRTWSAHWLRDSRFANAVADFLARETAGLEAYVDELRDRNPFRTGGASPSSPSPE